MNIDFQSPVICLENVAYYFIKRKGYFTKEKFWALKDLSFTLYKGESLGVIGRNGAGKTTLLRLLAGITAPDKGKIINYGYSASLLSLQAGFVPYLTGKENTILNGLILGLKKKYIEDCMNEIKDFSGLEDFFEQPISSYSSGMKARLGFSIAFQLDPDVLLVDEVLGVGDETFKKKSGLVMKEKIRSDKTVVLVSHAQNTIRELCDRAVWIEGGISKAEGLVKDVLKEYNNYLKVTR